MLPSSPPGDDSVLMLCILHTINVADVGVTPKWSSHVGPIPTPVYNSVQLYTLSGVQLSAMMFSN